MYCISEGQKDESILKQLSFGFFTFFESMKDDTIRLHNEKTAETVVLMSRLKV